MTNRLDRDFHLPGLLRFALPTIIMMLVVSLYTIVDGVLIARLVGKMPWPPQMWPIPPSASPWPWGSCWAPAAPPWWPTRWGPDIWRRPGGTSAFWPWWRCASAWRSAWRGPVRRAAGPAAGASDLLLDDTVTYLRVQLCFAPMAMLQLLFESFFVTAGRPGLGLGLATAAGLTNAVLDYLYMGPMQMGILGAALGTVTGYSIPAVAGCSFPAPPAGAPLWPPPRGSAHAGPGLLQRRVRDGDEPVHGGDYLSL